MDPTAKTPPLVTIVNSTKEDERVAAPVVQIDLAWVVVRVRTQVDGALVDVDRRFSRKSGFEHPPGGSWSAWRLSGADLRRLKPEKP